ncbi:MAG TPA: amidohydrolase family protein [Acidimicrobiia bacterium]|nr:amidohydrolase family protein [Acidimicrobiia bacterium]
MTFPAGPIFDAHFHVIDPRFPLQPNQGFVPEPFPVDAYRAAGGPLGGGGGGLLSGLRPNVAARRPRRPRAVVRRVAQLPKVVVDHLGMTAAGLKPLLGLVEAGASVKATGFGRAELDVPGALAAVAAVNPGALLFGTDLPSTRARRPFQPADIDLVVETLGEENSRRALYDNAMALYRPRRA